jgi:ketosteroid isomerase-like protein
MCRGRDPVLGRYSFDGGGPSGGSQRFIYRGEVTCVDRPPEPSAGATVPADWRPSDDDEQRARAATMAYFAAVDSGDVAALEAMMSPGHLGTSTREDRAEALRSFRQSAGAPGEHRIIRTTWYANPPGVEPGAYVAVDFDRSYRELSASCGYVAWHRQADGRLLLVREELGNAPRAAGVTPERLAEIRRLLQCRD